MSVNSKKDDVLQTIAEYVLHKDINSQEAYQTATCCLADALSCAMLALNFQECQKLLGPIVPGTIVPHGTHVPGTSYHLDPVMGAFNIGAMIRWLDFNDTWLGVEWGHPSDNLGGILAIADHLSRVQKVKREKQILMKEVLFAAIKAYEIQGVLALTNSFNRVGLDHVIFVKVATAAVVTAMLGGTHAQIVDAISHAWIDISSLRTYRQAVNGGSRKSWAAADATSRGVLFSLFVMRGEMGYPAALTAPQSGLCDVLFKGTPITLSRPLESYVMENILFKVAFPAEFHAQTAVECAILLHNEIGGKVEEIESIEIETHESAMRIIDKVGPLQNPAERDHCLQYMVAIALIKGSLNAFDYEEKASQDARIDTLRDKMKVRENKQFSIDYLDPNKRSIANRITLHLKNGIKLHKTIEYPYGHRRRREEGLPLLFKKFAANLKTRLPESKVEAILTLFQDSKKLSEMPVCDFIDLFS